MSVGLLIITHGCIGQQLLDTATSMLGFCPLQTAHLEVSQKSDPDNLLRQALKLLPFFRAGESENIAFDYSA